MGIYPQKVGITSGVDHGIKRINLGQKLGIATISVSLPVIVISGSSLLQGATADQAPNAAEWLSAISTFWGAIATAFGALLTGGALIYAARTYEKQREDRHAELLERRRSQAVSVSVRRLTGLLLDQTAVEVVNSSNLAIHNVRIFCLDPDGGVLEDGQPYVQDVLINDFRKEFGEELQFSSAYAEFTDAGGVRWIRTSKGTLFEKGKEPEGFDPREIGRDARAAKVVVQ
ncbi:hypothetical protein [Arthrobacter sp. 2MCAF14]|uniref:hypothetical protein n=1 Tax=Arthrobacter sp. 2MCAF14 TaxID=3232982 RepID=UPI003F8E0C9F